MRTPALAVLLVASTAGAAELRMEEEGPAVPAGEVIRDDLYAGGGAVVLDGEVQGDVVAWGGEVDVRGGVTGDVIAAGGTVRVAGSVGGSVRAAGGRVEIAGDVREDVVAAGGQILVTGAVGRDVMAAGGDVTLQGAVGRGVAAGAGNLVLGGAVGGDVKAQAGMVELLDGARIAGRLDYAADQPARIAPGAKVDGGITQTERLARRTSEFAWSLIDWFRRIVGFTALGLLLLLVAPRLAHGASLNLRASPGLSLLVGLAFLLAFPFASLFVFAVGLLVGGFWIGLFAMVLWALVLALGIPVAAGRLGAAVATRRDRRELKLIPSLLLGVVILTALPLLPWVGGILLALAAVIGAGAFVLAVARWQPPASAQPAHPAPGNTAAAGTPP